MKEVAEMAVQFLAALKCRALGARQGIPRAGEIEAFLGASR
jgi:hypothetical protein